MAIDYSLTGDGPTTVDYPFEDQNTATDPQQLIDYYRRLQDMNRVAADAKATEAKPVTQTIKTDPKTGEQTVTITGSAADLSPNNPLTPTVTPAVDYNKYIQQVESGSNPNIGYHYQPNEQGQRKSSAYGTYGITAPAYRDIQAVAPQFRGRDITTLSPDEQREASNILRTQYGNQLAMKGVEPTEANIRLAHLLGAGGARQYLTTGTFNPAAIAANGGEQRLRQLAESRLASAPATPVAPGVQMAGSTTTATDVAPTQNEIALGSLATRPGQPAKPTTSEQWASAFTQAQNEPGKVAELAFDPNAPQWLRNMAEQHLGNYIGQRRSEAQAMGMLTTAQQTGDMTPVAKEMAKTTDEGSWLKYLVFRHMGLSEASHNEANKLGLLDTTHKAMGPNGEYGLITYDGRGNAKSGVLADGTPIPEKDLTVWASMGAENAAKLKTAQTQATHAYTQAYTDLKKRQDAYLREGATQEDLRQRGLDDATIMNRARQAGRDVLTAAMQNYSLGGGQTFTRQQLQAAAQNATGITTPAEKPVAVVTPSVPSEYADSKLLGNWQAFRKGEDEKAKAKRTAIDPAEIDAAGRSLVAGNVKPTEFTGRGSEFRRFAVERALELDPNYTPMRYETTQAVIKRYTSGKDHETLVNIGTAGNHLLQFKQIAEQTPGATNVSSWNTFIQNLSKYGNAPEVKSKEAAAEFVAGEMVKAATGAQGSMSERQTLEKRLMAANTPAEWNKVIDDQLRLAHGRYGSMKASYEGSTKRKDFDTLIGMPDEVVAEFAKIEGQDAARKGKFKSAQQEDAYQKWKREQEQKK